MPHPLFSADPVVTPDKVAVVTGAAGGIGLAAARNFAEGGMRVVIVDHDVARLKAAAEDLTEIAGGPERIIAEALDVCDREALDNLAARVFDTFGGVQILMNNAGIQPGSGIFGPEEAWDRILRVNLIGVINGVQMFVPRMIASGAPGIVINTGSKQGITMPPGDPAYNVSKAAVKAFTEALQHDLRSTDGCRIAAHLLIPGFVFTGLTARGRTEKPAGAWTPEETVDFMLERLDAGDFYILCPDGEVTREIDEKRIAWTAGDIIENRPPLSRWHPDYADLFKSWSGLR